MQFLLERTVDIRLYAEQLSAPDTSNITGFNNIRNITHCVTHVEYLKH